MRWIPFILKSIFTSSLFLILFSVQAQPPDTVIIEKIKVLKKKIYVHQTDTVYKTDTVVRIKNDTIIVYKEKEKSTPTYTFLDHKAHFLIGCQLGSSKDIEHTHFWDTHTDYYYLEKAVVSDLRNVHVESYFKYIYQHLVAQFDIGFTSIRERIQYQTINSVNQLNYLTANLSLGWHSHIHQKLTLQMFIGGGYHYLIKQQGSYINPENTTEIKAAKSYFPTQKMLFTLSSNATLLYPITPKIYTSFSFFYKYLPNSITVVEHPVLYWKSFIGVSLGVAMRLD